ncbi:uncharacterized protein LOC111620800 [Centruroides sculpturatus]|uniref:uncharacterized protein LOC111620800 n=1 Tax=Centruroides sculpturatus TaxID=218467 RepID=UPI000C6E647A|nr:uncharacterized protein LOC111620800 [Centruroides sculpturatus]
MDKLIILNESTQSNIKLEQKNINGINLCSKHMKLSQKEQEILEKFIKSYTSSILEKFIRNIQKIRMSEKLQKDLKYVIRNLIINDPLQKDLNIFRYNANRKSSCEKNPMRSPGNDNDHDDDLNNKHTINYTLSKDKRDDRISSELWKKCQSVISTLLKNLLGRKSHGVKELRKLDDSSHTYRNESVNLRRDITFHEILRKILDVIVNFDEATTINGRMSSSLISRRDYKGSSAFCLTDQINVANVRFSSNEWINALIEHNSSTDINDSTHFSSIFNKNDIYGSSSKILDENIMQHLTTKLEEDLLQVSSEIFPTITVHQHSMIEHYPIKCSSSSIDIM